jgi:hypothetical protein
MQIFFYFYVKIVSLHLQLIFFAKTTLDLTHTVIVVCYEKRASRGRGGKGPKEGTVQCKQTAEREE